MSYLCRTKLSPTRSVTLSVLFPLLLLAAACGPGAGGNAPEQLTFAVKFADGKLTPDLVQVKQGDTVTLQIETDRPGAFHLHGYDLEQEATVGAASSFQFTADATGRFRLAFHSSTSAADSPSHDHADSHDHPNGDDTKGQHAGDRQEPDGGAATEAVELEIGFLEVLPR